MRRYGYWGYSDSCFLSQVTREERQEVVTNRYNGVRGKTPVERGDGCTEDPWEEGPKRKRRTGEASDDSPNPKGSTDDLQTQEVFWQKNIDEEESLVWIGLRTYR